MGCRSFRHPKGDRTVDMSYYLAPEEALENLSEMRQWAQLAYEPRCELRSAVKGAKIVMEEIWGP